MRNLGLKIMHPYIPYLLADIADAHRPETPYQHKKQSMAEHLEEIERWVAGDEPELTFGNY